MTTRALAAVAIGGATVVLCLASGEPEVDADATAGLSLALPESVGAWRGSAGEVSRAEREILPEDTEFAKMDYVRGHGLWQERVLCSIVLSGRDRTSIHRPEVCLVGQGWNIAASHEQRIALSNDAELAVRKLELRREHADGGVQRALYYYWFVADDATTPDHLERILLTAKDNIVANRNPRWAYVSVLAAVSEDHRRHGGQTLEETAGMLEDFVARATPAFQTSFDEPRWFQFRTSS